MPIVLYETFDAATDEISEYRATVLRCIELSCPKVNSISVVGPLPQKNEDGTCAEWHWGFVEVSAGDVRITLAICMDTLYLYGWKRGGIHSTDPWIVLNGEKPIGLMGNHVHLPFDGNYNHIGNPHTLFMSRAYLIKAVTKLHDCDPSHPSPGVMSVITAKRSNMRHVPIGIGVQGVVDTLILLGLPFDSEEGKAKKLDKYWFQILQALIETGTECMLFKEKKEERGIVKEHGEGEPKSGVNGMLEMENGEVMIEMEIDFKLIKHPPEPSEEDMPIKCPMPDPLSLIVEEVFEESRTESSQTVAELLEQKESIAETPSGTDDIEKHQTPLPEHAATAKTGSTHKSPHPKILQVFHQCKELQV